MEVKNILQNHKATFTTHGKALAAVKMFVEAINTGNESEVLALTTYSWQSKNKKLKLPRFQILEVKSLKYYSRVSFGVRFLVVYNETNRKAVILINFIMETGPYKPSEKGTFGFNPFIRTINN